MKTKKILAIAVWGAFPALVAAAEMPAPSITLPGTPPATLREIVQQAILHSPEVTSKWHNLKAAEEDVGIARGGYFPRVDVTAGSGRESLKQPPSTLTEDYTRSGYTVSLNQMLFDGFATRNEVRRLDHARLVRYYELLDASESTALEAARAYLDVLRYRFLVNLAEDNYVQHKATYEQLLRRTQTGVGRRVDLEQAGSRLALAEINLTTENANLHDVTARYQRLVGGPPPQVVLPPSQIDHGLPPSPKAALDVLHEQNPALLAAIENIASAQSDIAERRAAYVPKLSFRASADNTNNYLGVSGDRRYNVAELVVNWNLFNGGSDRAREKQSVEKKNVALDLREKACRDTRQTLLIAYNDVLRLKEQSRFLATQVRLLEKTRDAYRDQFNVGQRTLLDLLDTENELLSARRNAVNADTDLSLAYLRTYAGMGTLLQQLGLQRLDAKGPDAAEMADLDASHLCPDEPVTVGAASRADLDARAMAMLDSESLIGGAPQPVAAPLPAALPAPAPAPAPVAGPAPAPGAEDDVLIQVKAWAAAWSARNYDDYLAYYAPDFQPDNGLSREAWDGLRRKRIAPRGRIDVELRDIKVSLKGGDRALVEFRQVYRSDVFSDTTQKTLEMRKTDGKWLIVRETAVPCAHSTSGGCTGD